MKLQSSAFCRSNNHGKEVIDMVKTLARGKQYLTDAYWSAVGMASAAMLTLQPVLATGTGTGTATIWNRFSTILKDVYGQVVAISTIVAVTVAAIALLIRMISRNQRAVDEATNWLKTESFRQESERLRIPWLGK
jgi:hypothetical protein